MRSGYNGALVQAVTYTGEAATLTWELQHSLCAAAGRATPGSDISRDNPQEVLRRAQPETYLDKYCAYSAADNHVVADGCSWLDQEFTHVSGTLGGGVGYMCAHSNCECRVVVEGTTARDAGTDGGSCVPEEDAAAGINAGGTGTLRAGDAVFCSA